MVRDCIDAVETILAILLSQLTRKKTVETPRYMSNIVQIQLPSDEYRPHDTGSTARRFARAEDSTFR